MLKDNSKETQFVDEQLKQAQIIKLGCFFFEEWQLCNMLKYWIHSIQTTADSINNMKKKIAPRNDRFALL